MGSLAGAAAVAAVDAAPSSTTAIGPDRASAKQSGGSWSLPSHRSSRARSTTSEQRPGPCPPSCPFGYLTRNRRFWTSVPGWGASPWHWPPTETEAGPTRVSTSSRQGSGGVVRTRKYPNYTFTLADIYNKEYNPAGRLKASEYRFPFDDETFDLVVLGSVFHPHAPGHYIAGSPDSQEGPAHAVPCNLDAESLPRRRQAGVVLRARPALGGRRQRPGSWPSPTKRTTPELFEEHELSCTILAGGRVVRTRHAPAALVP